MKPPGVVLVVEDDDDDLFFLQRELTKVGSPLVKHARDGRVAVDYLQGNGIYADRTQYPMPDMVFLDLKTPHLSGHEVLRWIRGQREFDQLRVYVLTGSDEPKDRAQVDAVGAAGYIVKPLLAPQLKELFG
jgi:CheY-like chemotaxis protein